MPYLKISFEQPLREARAELERQYLEYHLSLHDWRFDEVRRIAGVTRSHLYRLAHKLGVASASNVSDTVESSQNVNAQTPS